MKANDALRMEGAFTRNYMMFGLVILVYFFGIVLINYWRTTLYFLICGFSFFTIEYKFHKLIENALVIQYSIL